MKRLGSAVAAISAVVNRRDPESLYGWSLKGGLSIGDQILFSGGNFIFGVLLARWLPVLEYGAYALAFAALLVIYQLHQSLITDPMSVLGPAYYTESLPAYLTTQLRMHFVATVPAGILVGLVGTVIAGHVDPAGAVIASELGVMGFSLPLLLLPWFLRRAFYVLLQPQVAAIGSAVYAVAIVSAVLVLRHWLLLNFMTAVLAMAASGLLSGAVLYARLAGIKGDRAILNFTEVSRQNWQYARWLVASALLMVLAAQMPIFIAGRMLGVRAAGVVDVLQSFSQPMILSIGAMTAIALPVLSRDFALGRHAALEHKVAILTRVLYVLAGGFTALLFVFKGSLEHLLYGGRFEAYVAIVPIFGLVPVLLALYWGPAVGLQAAQRPQAVLIVSAIWLPASFGLCIALASTWGLPGLAAGTILGYLMMVVVCRFLYETWVRRTHHAV
jgi:O-antigen/teichoic acid export membrane protein